MKRTVISIKKGSAYSRDSRSLKWLDLMLRKAEESLYPSFLRNTAREYDAANTISGTWLSQDTFANTWKDKDYWLFFGGEFETIDLDSLVKSNYILCFLFVDCPNRAYECKGIRIYKGIYAENLRNRKLEFMPEPTAEILFDAEDGYSKVHEAVADIIKDYKAIPLEKKGGQAIRDVLRSFEAVDTQCQSLMRGICIQESFGTYFRIPDLKQILEIKGLAESNKSVCSRMFRDISFDLKAILLDFYDGKVENLGSFTIDLNQYKHIDYKTLNRRLKKLSEKTEIIAGGYYFAHTFKFKEVLKPEAGAETLTIDFEIALRGSL